MTDEEIEVVAEELAKVGGTSWYPGRERGQFLRLVSDRYRDHARTVIAALDRHRASKDPIPSQDHTNDPQFEFDGKADPGEKPDIQPGATVFYRPPGDQRTYPCHVVEIKGDRAYLAPIVRACIGWVSIETTREPPAESALEDN